jgi:ABC-type glycerol-3-phosphate transport system substrate-binding protein
MSPDIKTLSIYFAILVLLSGCSVFSRPTPTPEPVTIRFTFIGNTEIYKALAQEFHETYPHLTVELDEIIYITGDLSQVESRADVNRVMPLLLQTDSLSNYLPMGDLLKLSELLSPADFFPGSLKALQIEGEQMGIPAGISQVVMYYSILRFKIAGIEAPPPDWELADFINLAAKVQKQGRIPDTSDDVVYGFCTSPYFYDPLYFTYLFGGQLFDRLPNPTFPTLNMPENIDAIKWYASLRNEYQIIQPQADDRQYFQYISGYQCGLWMFGRELEVLYNMRKEDVGVLPLPKTKTGINFASMESYHIQKSSPHPLEAPSALGICCLLSPGS